MATKPLKPGKMTFFRTPEELRAWLEKHHGAAGELWIGFYKKDAQEKGITKGITYKEALDEALGFGWIDGVRLSVDAERYTIRFTPRRTGSVWSKVNIARARELIAEGRLRPAGLQAFEARDEAKANQYSYEREKRELDPAHQRQLEANPAAWEFFRAQPPYYQRMARWYVMSAKREETRQRRLATLIEDSAQGRRLAGFPSPAKERKPGRG